MDARFAEHARHLLVDLGDDDPSRLHRCALVAARNAQRAIALIVGGRERHDSAVADQTLDTREIGGQVVRNASMYALPVIFILPNGANERFIANMTSHIGVEHLDALTRRALHERNIGEFLIAFLDFTRDRARISCAIGKRTVAVWRNDLHDVFHGNEFLLVELFPIGH